MGLGNPKKPVVTDVKGTPWKRG